MVQAFTKPVTFADFIEWYPNTGVRYELHDGVIIEMNQPVGDHEKVVGFLARKLTVEFDRLDFPYIIPKTVFVKPATADSAYSPDVLLLNVDNLHNEPLWQKSSTVTQAASIPLVVEVVSTNWRDDYHRKLADYEVMGIPEYWIVDYAALGGRLFIGNPKQPTISVYSLVEDEYQVSLFRGDERIISPTFPELSLRAAQIFRAGSAI
jgi:Uma2 family endonuclease